MAEINEDGEQKTGAGELEIRTTPETYRKGGKNAQSDQETHHQTDQANPHRYGHYRRPLHLSPLPQVKVTDWLEEKPDLSPLIVSQCSANECLSRKLFCNSDIG